MSDWKMKIHLKENWREQDPKLIEASVKACKEAMRRNLEANTVIIKPDGVIGWDDKKGGFITRWDNRIAWNIEQRESLNIESRWQDWQPLPENSPWKFLRQEVDKTPEDSNILMSPETFNECPFRPTVPSIVSYKMVENQTAYVGTLWGRRLFLGASGCVRDGVVKVYGQGQDWTEPLKIINLQAMRIWEDRW